MNQCCIKQHWFGISDVSENADSQIFTFEYENLREFETFFENILGCESGAHMGSIHEKNRGKQSRATVFLKGLSPQFESGHFCWRLWSMGKGSPPPALASALGKVQAPVQWERGCIMYLESCINVLYRNQCNFLASTLWLLFHFAPDTRGGGIL
jgi:hypothetical protein